MHCHDEKFVIHLWKERVNCDEFFFFHWFIICSWNFCVYGEQTDCVDGNSIKWTEINRFSAIHGRQNTNWIRESIRLCHMKNPKCIIESSWVVNKLWRGNFFFIIIQCLVWKCDAKMKLFHFLQKFNQRENWDKVKLRCLDLRLWFNYPWSAESARILCLPSFSVLTQVIWENSQQFTMFFENFKFP